jgi:hypothetical protein
MDFVKLITSTDYNHYKLTIDLIIPPMYHKLTIDLIIPPIYLDLKYSKAIFVVSIHINYYFED